MTSYGCKRFDKLQRMLQTRRNRILDIEKEMRQLEAQYAIDMSKYKVGDIVMYGDVECVIGSVSFKEDEVFKLDSVHYNLRLKGSSMIYKYLAPCRSIKQVKSIDL